MQTLKGTRLRETYVLVALVAALTAVTGLSAAGLVFATPSPNGPGQPGAPTTTCGTPGVTSQTPPSATARGSPFNSIGVAGTVYAGNPLTHSLANANSPHAVSQYDIACFQLTQH